MKDILLSAGTGLLIGISFTILKLPIPAPTAFAGIAGILGVYCGYILTSYLLGTIQ